MTLLQEPSALSLKNTALAYKALRCHIHGVKTRPDGKLRDLSFMPYQEFKNSSVDAVHAVSDSAY